MGSAPVNGGLEKTSGNTYHKCTFQYVAILFSFFPFFPSSFSVVISTFSQVFLYNLMMYVIYLCAYRGV